MSNVITEYHNKKESESVKTNNQWWTEDEKEVYKHIHSLVQSISKDQSYRHNDFVKFARLYSNKELMGFAANLYSKSTRENLASNNRLTLNIIKSCVDTAASKIGKMRPKPLFLTSNGKFEEQQRGKKLTKYIEGVFEDQKVYELAARIFIDSCIFGSGFIKIYHDSDKIRYERVLPSEIIVDDSESVYGKPRQIHQIKYISREVLLGMFPEYESKIQAVIGGVEGDYTANSDMIKVIESWHLPSSSKSRDGSHVISIDNCTLFSEDYNKDYFPFVKFNWSDKILGYFGAGLSEELVGIQVEINKLLMTIQKAQHLAAIPRVYVDVASKVVSAHINNEIGAIVKYQGTAPIISSSQAMPVEVYNHLENLYNKAYQITGISQLSATSLKPSGVNSGVAMREYQDIETERFMLTAQRYEAMFLDLAKITVKLSKELFEYNPNMSVKVKGGKFIESIKWKDVDIEEEKFSLKVYPTSMLPSSPQGRLDKVQELIQAGFISREDGLALLDYPDLDSVMNLELASRDVVMDILSKIADEGKYTAPEPFMNLQMALKISQSFYLKCQLDDYPEERLQLLRDFMEDVGGLIEIQNQQQVVETPAELQDINQIATANPEPLPTSELVPQV